MFSYIMRLLLEVTFVRKSNIDKFRGLLNEGYLVKRDPFPVASIVEEGLARQRAGEPIPKDREFLLNPANWDETIIILLHPKTGEQVLVVTREEQVIKAARAKYRERFEPVGLWIRAHCEARGSSATSAPVYHVDRFIEPLDGFRGWSFQKDDIPSRFIVSKKLDVVDESSRIAAVGELEHILGCLAAAIGLGLHIWHLAVSHIPKGFPATSWGKVEHVLPPPTSDELQQLDVCVATPEVWAIANGMNRAYCENSKQARLTTLWSSCEQLFKTGGKRLLGDDEVDRIVAQLDSIEMLAEDQDLLAKTRKLLEDWLKKLKKQTSNELMGENIADLLGISNGESTRRVREAFKLRGMFTHSLSDAETIRVDESLAFLHSALQHLLEQTVNAKDQEGNWG